MLPYASIMPIHLMTFFSSLSSSTEPSFLNISLFALIRMLLSQPQCSHYHLHHSVFSIVALRVCLFFFPPLLFEKWNAGSTFTYEQKEAEADSQLVKASHRA